VLFNSIEFVIFFPVVTVLYFLLPHTLRWLLLLIASCVFYMAFVPKYILVLFTLIIVDFTAGIFIEKAEGKKRKLIFFGSIFANLSILVFFKYFNFFSDIVFRLANRLDIAYSHPLLTWALPLGISFHTFQSMSYTFEVYYGRQKALHHLGIYALYVMFYPQLVAGPIERPQNLLPQFFTKHHFSYSRLVDGLRLMASGFIKKILIADYLALFVDSIFNEFRAYQGLALWIATYFFAFQIYCDFSGYTDIARGAAKVMGYDLMENFNRPYFAKSISEFWRRWHISLSTWLRDYLYIPLGGNRVSWIRRIINVFIVFLISGLWHGANFTYLAWGALHGAYILLGMMFAPFFHYARGFFVKASLISLLFLLS